MTSPRTLRIFADQWMAEYNGSKRARSRFASQLVSTALQQSLEPALSDVGGFSNPLIIELSPDAYAQLESLANQHGLEIFTVAAGLLEAKKGEVMNERQLAAGEDQRAVEELALQKAEIEQRAQEIAIIAQAKLENPHFAQPRIWKHEGRICFKSYGDEGAVTAIRALPGAKWSKELKCWSISAKYETRLEALKPVLRQAKARSYAETIWEFEHDPPPPVKGVKFSVDGRMLSIHHDFDREALEIYNMLKRQKIVSYNGRAWQVPWRDRMKFFEHLPRIGSAVNRAKP